jgi:glycerol-3-phosphate dehydrogenase (NAD(P)+)
MGFGMNTKAFIGTLAIQEMENICLALGGLPETVHGLAGLGDLLTTGWSQHSRNRTLGEKLGSGADWQTFLREKTVEGAGACRTIKELTAGSVETRPLLEMIYAVLFAEQPAADTVRRFLRDFSYS